MTSLVEIRSRIAGAVVKEEAAQKRFCTLERFGRIDALNWVLTIIDTELTLHEEETSHAQVQPDGKEG